MRRIVPLVISALVASTCASSWVDAEAREHARRAPAVPAAATSTAAPPAAAPPVSFDPTECPMPLITARDAARIECGWLDVPADRTDPTGPRVQVAVAVVASTADDPEPDPVVYLHGGPGGLALDDYLEWTTPSHDLLARRDVILVDQRGAGRSMPSLNCPASEDSNSSAVELARCADALADEGYSLDDFTTAQIAADLIDLREALGYEQWNLYGVSYGTRVALTMLDTSDSGIRSVVLDSPYPPVVEAYDEQVPNARATIDDVLVACRDEPACNEAFGDLRAPLRDLLVELRADPRPSVIGDDDLQLIVDDTLLAGAVFGALYDRFLIVDVPLAIDTAIGGDLTTALELLGSAAGFAGPGRAPSVTTGQDDNDTDEYDTLYDAELAFWAAECAEELERSDEEALTSQLPDDALDRALFGDVASAFAVCGRLDLDASTDVSQREVASAVPTLLIVGQYDPITPVAWARRAADTLSRSQVLEIPGAGHAASFEECPRQALVDFLDEPALPVDTPCIGSLAAAPFRLE